MEKFDIVIVGAGPTGLGAAIRLQQHKHEDYMMFDAFDEVTLCIALRTARRMRHCLCLFPASAVVP